MLKGKRFPTIKAKSLSGKTTVLPDDAEGDVTLIGIAFERKAQAMLDSWTDYFEDLCSGKDVYELPMIDGHFWKIFSGFIDKGMKSGIPEEKHDHVVTYYGTTSRFREELFLEDKELGYVFLLDEDGNILFKGEGYADEEGKKEMLKHVKKTCSLGKSEIE